MAWLPQLLSQNVVTCFQVLLANALSWILLLCVSHSSFLPSEALPVGNSPKGSRREASGSDDDSDNVEQAFISPEHQVYMRLTMNKPQMDRNLHKKPPTYVRRGKLFNRNGYLLRIKRDGTVDGTTDSNSPLGKYFNNFFCFKLKKTKKSSDLIWMERSRYKPWYESRDVIFRQKLYSSSTFKARFPAAVWEVSLRSFPVETPEDRKKESRRRQKPNVRAPPSLLKNINLYKETVEDALWMPQKGRGGEGEGGVWKTTVLWTI